MPRDDEVLEADEADQNGGKKGSRIAIRPTRRRANKQRGHGTFENDRPPICGVVGRTSGHACLTVVPNANKATLKQVVLKATWPGARVCTDEWQGDNDLPAMGRVRAAVCHAAWEWARDDDGDGVREVHCSTLEGLWTGLRTFLRRFRGVSKKDLYQYVTLFEWGYNVKRATTEFFRALLGVESATRC